LLLAGALQAPAFAADDVLLPDGLMSPTSKEQTKPDAFKKAPPMAGRTETGDKTCRPNLRAPFARASSRR
jgi:hypothetical protein